MLSSNVVRACVCVRARAQVIDNKSASISPYDMKADIWSMGIVCLELAHVTPPLSDIHPMKAMFQIPLNDPPTLNDPSKWSAHFPTFLARALVRSPVAVCVQESHSPTHAHTGQTTDESRHCRRAAGAPLARRRRQRHANTRTCACCDV
jgi:serine/threonine protein kinase